MTRREMGKVFIIGAGPGDVGLLSARGIRLLGEAEVVVYDTAVAPTLRWARPEAERIAAGAPAEQDTAQDALSMLVADKAREGLIVARLKWGDPFLFDSAAKEAMFLHEQGVPFEVVPGIPMAVAASAYAGVPLTYPGFGDALVLLRGHEDESGRLPQVDWSAVARLEGTIACYTAGRLAPVILQKLLDGGMPGETAAAWIVRGSQAGQHTDTGTISTFVDKFSADVPRDPALLLIGGVVGLREHLRWFDERPLFGRRVVVTRSQEQSQDLVDTLENLGAEVLQAPTFRLAPAEDPEALDRAAASVDGYEWVIFESANAVARFLAALTRGPRDIRALGDVRVCALGASTAERLLAVGLKADLVLAEAGTERVVDAISAEYALEGQRVLIVRPDHLREHLAGDLARRGATVTDLVAYRTEAAPADSPAAQELYRRLLEDQIDAVTFTSPTAVERFAALIGEDQAADLLNTTVVAAIGPVTAAAASELGVERPLVSDTYTVEGLTRVLVERFSKLQPERR